MLDLRLIKEDKELLKCSTFKEGVEYLKYPDSHQDKRLTLGQFRKIPKPLELDGLVRNMVAIAVVMALMRLFKEVEIQDSKPEQIVAEKKMGRNEPRPCVSGKRYKRCCGKS